MLTIAAAKAAEPRLRPYKLADANGLYLFVAPTGLKSWRMKYRFAGKEKLLTFGRFPKLSLADARARRETAKGQLRAGIDPAAAPAASDFETTARAWFALQCPRWSDSHAADVLSSLERDVFPSLGQRSMARIRPTNVLAIVHSIEKRGRVQTAKRMRQRLSAIFRYAMSQELVTADPAAQLDQAMQAAPLSRPMPALSTIEDARALIRESARVGLSGLPSIRLASHFLALTAVRMATVRGADWNEFEDLDGRAPLWRVPPARMKLSQAKKNEDRFAHLVPLSPLAVKILRSAAGGIADDSHFPRRGLVFPGRDRTKPIGEGAIGDLYIRVGYRGRHVPHGWRATFSTILNEQLGREWRWDIDNALAHAPKDKVEAAYNRSEQLDRRRELFCRWGDIFAH